MLRFCSTPTGLIDVAHILSSLELYPTDGWERWNDPPGRPCFDDCLDRPAAVLDVPPNSSIELAERKAEFLFQVRDSFPLFWIDQRD